MRIETLIPLVSQVKRVELQRRLVELNSQLRPERSHPPSRPGYGKPSNLAASAAGVNGIGGLQFQAKAPPGEGRLIKLPFYLYEMDFTQSAFVAPEVGPMVVTSQGADIVDEVSPTVIATMPNDAGGRRVLSGFKFRTPQISWAKLRVVGFETTQMQTVYGGNDPTATAATPSPLPDSAALVDLYDVGPGSGATGRYDSFASIPVLPAPVGPTQGGAPAPALWLPPSFTALATSIDFGRVLVGSSATVAVVFTDTVGTLRNLIAEASTDAAYTTNANPGVDFVPANGSLSINFTFAPTALGVVTANVTITFQIGANPLVIFTVPVTGVGVQNNYYRNGNLFLLVKGLSIGGGANLLSQEGFIDGAIYDTRLPEVPGLRGNPELDSPNRAYIEVALVGPQLATITFSMALLCEVLEDAEFGKPISGPYARGVSLMRRMPDGANVQVD